MTSNGQSISGYQADPREIIDGLLNRIATLAVEIAAKDAYIVHLEGASRLDAVATSTATKENQ